MDDLAGPEAGRVVEWTINASAWKILKEIKKPEASGGWPVDTGVSRRKWGFERVKKTGGRVIFVIFNDAPALRGRLKGHAYAPWVYAKGDGNLRRAIAPGIVRRAILSTIPTLEKNYFDRLNRILAKRRKHGR